MLGLDELIILQIKSTAHWRRLKAEGLSKDVRNVKAAKLLETIASELRESDGVRYANTLTMYAGEDNGFYTEILSGITRAVDFQWEPQSAEQLVNQFITFLNYSYAGRRIVCFSRYVTPNGGCGGKAQSDKGRLVEAVSIPWFDIIALLKRDPDAAFQIPPERWEEIVAGAYKRAGFDEVILTPRSGDYGRDVIAIKKGLGMIRVIDQVKAYRPPHLVGANDVRALIGGLQADGASKGSLTTNSGFAPRMKADPLILPWMPARLELIDAASLLGRLRQIAALHKSGPLTHGQQVERRQIAQDFWTGKPC
jgi:restriction system protein